MNFLNLNSSFTYSQFASVPILQQCMGLTTICKNSLGIIKDLAVKILFKNIETDEEKLNLEYKTLSDFIALVDYYDSFLENPKFPIGHIKVELIDFIEKFDCEIKDKLIENSNNKIILNFAKELKPINMLNTENLFEIIKVYEQKNETTFLIELTQTVIKIAYAKYEKNCSENESFKTRNDLNKALNKFQNLQWANRFRYNLIPLTLKQRLQNIALGIITLIPVISSIYHIFLLKFVFSKVEPKQLKGATCNT